MALCLAGCVSGGIALSDATKAYLEGSWGVSDQTYPSCLNANDVGSSGLIHGNEYIFAFDKTGGTVVFFDRIEFISTRYRILGAEERDGSVILRATGPQPNIMRLRLTPPDGFQQNIDGVLQDFSADVTFLKCSGLTANVAAALKDAVPDDRQ